MLTLAVAHETETISRISPSLERRDIAIEHVSVTGQSTQLANPRIDPSGIDVGFVFPGRMTEGGVLDALLGVPWVNDREAVLRSRNKAETLLRLEQSGLPVPETVLVSNPTEEEVVSAAFDRLGSPVVLKPTTTTRGTGVLKASDPDSLRGALDYVELIHDFPATGDRSYLLQEYLPDARDFRVMVLDGEYAGAVERSFSAEKQTAGQWKTNVHRGAKAEGVLPAPRIRELAIDAAVELDVPFLGVDVLSTGDRTVIAETNARPTIDDPKKYVDGFLDELASLIEKTAMGAESQPTKETDG